MRGMKTVLLVSAGMLAGCLAVAGNGERRTTGDSMHIGFSMENAAGESTSAFYAGDTVHFVFRVHNAGAEPRTLEFTFPPHRVSVFPTEGDAPVWQAFEGRMFPQVMRAQEVPAGEDITFSVEWELQDVPPGRYRVQPEFIGFARPGGQLQRKLTAISISIE